MSKFKLTNTFDDLFSSENNTGFLIAVLISLMMACLFLSAIEPRDQSFEIILGWSLSCVFGFFNWLIAVFSKSPNVKKFFFGAFILGPASQIIYLAVAFEAIRYFHLATRAFVMPFLITYFLLMFYHIGRLYASDRRNIKELSTV